MKKFFLLCLTLFILILFGNYAISQVNPKGPQNKTLKERGLIPIPKQVTPVGPVKAILPSPNGPVSPMTLKVPLDGSFTQVYFPNASNGGAGFYTDDGWTDAITLPFTFCLYGTNETQFFINSNGNVSFGAGYGQFTSTGFPISGFPMLAPFWADVDLRGAGAPHGSVWYKMEAQHVIIIWDSVGYFEAQGDKRNTFELIFTDRNDPLIGVNNNVAFSYTNMQWTTGSFSGGTGGFGGTPATVGVNKGDGVKYALVGRFDHAGTDFYGANGAPGGIGYLQGQYYTFDACQETVIIPPGNVPISKWALFIIGAALLGVGTIYILRKRQSDVNV